MAGIGFELKKLFTKKGIINKLCAYSYTGFITSGPMILGILFLLLISFVGQVFGLDLHSRNLLISIVTYMLLGSLILSGITSMVGTRFISDMIYTNQEDLILPSFEGLLAIMAPLGAIAAALFLIFSGVGSLLIFLAFTLFMELIVVWVATSYLTAVKDYRGVLWSYVIAITISVGCDWLACLFFGVTIELLLAGVCLGYGFMMCMDITLIYKTFFDGKREHFLWLKWLERYKPLICIGTLTNMGLYAHIVIAWFGPLGEQVQGLYYAAPSHDIPAMLAFLTVLMTTVNFVVSTEVNFYPRYRQYYDLFNGTGSITEIDLAQEEMLTVLDHELANLSRKQLLLSAAVISLGPTVLETLPLGFDSSMDSYLRILCVGYGAYAIANAVMLILLYFADYHDGAIATGIFAITTTIFSIIGLFYPTDFYCYGFAAGAIFYLMSAWFFLYRYTENLPYTILSVQPLAATEDGRTLSKLADKLNSKKFS